MIVVLDRDCSLKEKAAVVRFVEQRGGRLLVSVVGDETHIGLIDSDARSLATDISAMAGVSEIRAVAPPYPHVSREYQPESTEVRVGNVVIGGDEVVVIAGPCSVESGEQLEAVATSVAANGGRAVRLRSTRTASIISLGFERPLPSRCWPVLGFVTPAR